MKTYDPDLKKQVVDECIQVGNIRLVARRHNLSPNTVNGWVKASRRRGSVEPLPRKASQRIAEAERRIEAMGEENSRLKRIVADKEVENAILRELLEKANPPRPTRWK